MCQNVQVASDPERPNVLSRQPAGSRIRPALHQQLRALPHPLHLFEFLTGSGHYHLGCFEGSTDSLKVAQDRLPELLVPHLNGRQRVLDVGCCLGGTSAFLVSEGFETVGIDPSREALAYARRASRASPSPSFVETDLAGYRPFKPTARFGGIVMIEVLQHLPSLRRLASLCGPLLTGGAVIVILDTFTIRDLAQVPFHRKGAIAELASALGFTIVERCDLSRQVFPSFARLLEAIEASHGELRAFFSETRPAWERELSELRQQILHLEAAFANRELVFELVVIRQPS